MIIELSYPKNIGHHDKMLFDDIKKYHVSVPVLQQLKNVFVNHDGLVLKNFKLNVRSGYNLKGNKDINFYWAYWKLILEQYLVCKFGKSLKSLKFPNQKVTYSIVHTKWFNYGFWLNDALNRCILLEENYSNNNLVLLLPESILKIPYVKETLSVFNFNIKVIPEGEHCFVERFVLPETREYTAYFDPISIRRIRKRFLKVALVKTNISVFPTKIYLSRKERGVRCLENEEQVEKVLVDLGFTVLNFDSLSVWDQIAYMHHASWFVSNHGAGFSNILFMQKGSKVLEFLEYDFAHYGNPFPHWRLATLNKLEYYFLLGIAKETEFIQYVENKNTNSFDRMSKVNRLISIDTEQLKKIING